ncbi:helix-turn-helix transcriptional regulator [Sinomonas atrocyanea]|uniref:helix-turn-helix domain-containing protein n=1 Tax=Sinomonas atrocyanea TaxID=37927 RepID=UPI002783143B|nr:helix-turn-helix transcriptional regulator [Sinomonas atrocyanea]MDQ0259540.1 transcriptional regulator with XRE-family HTH domain [Sinomonas atrocyanea]MDR6623201.1 transcriptional regulator with XRE-family HTH domain [Sinomonas atrocyanea]
MPTDHNRSFGTKSSRRRAKYLAKQNLELVSGLVAVRVESGLKQKDVAEMLGITQQAVSEFERMVTPATLTRISSYAHAVGALVTHHVAADKGQLESRGDGWIQIHDLTAARDDRASAACSVEPLEAAPARAGETTRTVRSDVAAASWASGAFDSSHIGKMAAESKRTDFLLAA